jgi:ABC-type dipeptide/oligopeptide/nickel transport system permease component
VGRTLIDAIFHRDFTMVQAVVFLVAFGVLLLNLIIDMVYAWLDPRIRYS